MTNPDHIEFHRFSPDQACPGCDHALGEGLPSTPCDYEVRQVFDIPPEKLEITEHRARRCRCSGCGKRVTAPFPGNVTAPTQYGPRIQAAILYLRDYQLLPYARLSQLFGDLFNTPISEGTLANIVARGSQKAGEALEPIKQALIDSPVAHADEWSGAT